MSEPSGDPPNPPPEDGSPAVELDREPPSDGDRRRAGMSRRQALRRVGGGGLSVLGAGMVVGAVGSHAVAHARSADAATDVAAGMVGHDPMASAAYGGGADGRLSGGLPAGDAAGPYSGPFSAPDDIAADALDALTLAPPRQDGPVEVDLSVVERPHQISRAHRIEAWTYAGSVPGPIIRATEGQTIRVRFANRTAHDHNVHFHGRHSPQVDGWEPIPPGGEVVYELTAGPAGVHPYHCHTMPIDAHIARGLYGTLIVDPPEGRPDAHEVVLVLSGFDVDGDGRNDVYAFNGIAGFYERFPIKVGVGEPVRAYVLNTIEYDPIASFHLHAETFDVYPAGIGARPAFTTDVLSLGQMDRAILEFTLPEIGRYMFHPHQHAIAHRGATGWFSAI